MRRLLGICAALAALAAVVVATAAGGGGGDGVPTYRIELRNAFDLTVGGEFKIAGSTAGTITKIEVDRRHLTALVTVTEDKAKGFRLRSTARCVSRPQSLVGEYFVSCLPGRGGRLLANNAVVPVRSTTSTVPVDLVTNILRQPQRDRFRLILNEFGTALAGRGGDLNEAIRSGVPALRDTDRTLAILARQRTTLARLTTNADRVVGALARRRRDVSRFVRDAGGAATTSALHGERLAAAIERTPRFLTELRSTMSTLDEFSRAQTPAAVQLGRVARPLDGFLADLEPFTRASRPALRGVGRTARRGTPAVEAARPLARQLAKTTLHLPELATNLRFITEHLDDRDFGAEHDPKAVQQLAAPGPGGDRFTGLEGFLQFFFDQGMVANQYTAMGHFLSLGIQVANACSQFQTGDSLRRHPDVEKQCSGNVYGPSSPGIHTPDPGKRPGSYATGGTSSSDAAAARRAATAANAAGSQRDAGAAQAAPPTPAGLDYLLGP